MSSIFKPTPPPPPKPIPPPLMPDPNSPQVLAAKRATADSLNNGRQASILTTQQNRGTIAAGTKLGG